MIDSAANKPFLEEVHRLTAQSRDIQFRRAGAAHYSQRYEDPQVEDRLDLAKAQALEFALQRQGLGICSGIRLPFGDSPHNAETLPVEQLVPQFQKYEYERWNDDYGQWKSYFTIRQILMLCPDHLNESPDHIKRFDERGVVSPVEDQGGKLVAVKTLADVTAVPVVRRYHHEIYRQFGIDPSYRRKLFGKPLNSHDLLKEVDDPTDLSKYMR